jgi:hypothetical protein
MTRKKTTEEERAELAQRIPQTEEALRQARARVRSLKEQLDEERFRYDFLGQREQREKSQEALMARRAVERCQPVWKDVPTQQKPGWFIVSNVLDGLIHVEGMGGERWAFRTKTGDGGLPYRLDAVQTILVWREYCEKQRRMKEQPE